MTGIVNKNVVKGIQCQLEGMGLYSSLIDGIWGHGSNNGFNKLLATYKGSLVLDIVNWRDNSSVIKGIQRALQDCGLYHYAIDGIWGKGSQKGLDELVNTYASANDTKHHDLPWSNRVGRVFVERVKELAKQNGFDNDFCGWLMACMYFETAGTFSPTIKNAAGAPYWGLIQFGNAAAKDLGTTTTYLRSLTAVEQLEWVFKYFVMWRKRGKQYKQLEDLYLTIFYPAAVGKDADTTIFIAGTTAYRQNKGLDVDRDGIILVGEICSKIYDTYFEGCLSKNRLTI